MKRLFTILAAVLLTASVFAQSPEKMSYQAVIRNSSDALVINSQVGMQISILQGTENGTPVYVEIQTTTTNANGLVSVEIGNGATSDDFSGIDWSGPYFIKTEIDPTGGTNYTITGTSQLLSVPYAFHAKSAERITEEITESDPVYSGSEAVNITTADITNLSNLSGTNTGDQDVSAMALNTQAIKDTASQIRADIPDVSGTNTGDQMLSISGSQLTISSGNTISLPASNGNSSLPTYSTADIATLSPSSGDAVYNSTENLYQIFDGSKWICFPVNCWPQPTTSNAGEDQIYTEGVLTATLAANAPEVGHGTGQWSIVSGTGGSFDDTSNPNATFSGIINELYDLKWTISTNCQVSEDNVIIAFAEDKAGNQVADIEGNTYNTVWIGGRNWMAENLKTTKYNDGTDIPNVTDGTEWGELRYGSFTGVPGSIENFEHAAYCWYDNDQATYGDIYGALYNWYAINTTKLCPSGWHVSTYAEWESLEDYLGNEVGGKLKETGTSHWVSPNTGATNEKGFTALPGGQRTYNGSFNSMGSNGYWFISSGHYETGYYFFISNSSSYLHDTYEGTKNSGLSVRCIRD